MRRLYLWTEMLFLFVGLPLLYYFEMIPVHKAIPLVLVFLYCLFIVIKDKNFDREIFRVKRNYPWQDFLLKGSILLIITSIWVYVFRADVFFHLPRNNFWIWVAVIISYPIWSAYTQEFIFRAFYYHRYKTLFTSPVVMLLINAFCFAMAHIIFRNWVALIFTFVGSLIFSYTYLRNKSLNAVFLEHSLYGNILFTNGLGIYFYLPM
ncbi:CPBP family intramembrane glutamic endopeptidase [Marinifilum caeruleilacunae]|uniref:CPBP family intramembrane metalloprotease n=1 Tax=Marinifilum caeruleilacunae TaxID=2499076 RepID=A0ABX1WXX2_9BACT|nr:CPBP family intramembrane glutamic endopeptidase [Marinifilum caeruleilacunae]NOU60887.1 CPBP family intramembrane metalloprotease [Marinifilum caeruleilacunae]